MKGAVEGRHITEMAVKSDKGMYFADTENAILYWPSVLTLPFGMFYPQHKIAFLHSVNSEGETVSHGETVALLLGGVIKERIIQLVAFQHCLLILTGEINPLTKFISILTHLLCHFLAEGTVMTLGDMAEIALDKKEMTSITPLPLMEFGGEMQESMDKFENSRFESFEEIPMRCMPNMPPEGEEVVDIFAHHSRAYAVTIPKLSTRSLK